LTPYQLRELCSVEWEDYVNDILEGGVEWGSWFISEQLLRNSIFRHSFHPVEGPATL